MSSLQATFPRARRSGRRDIPCSRSTRRSSSIASLNLCEQRQRLAPGVERFAFQALQQQGAIVARVVVSSRSRRRSASQSISYSPPSVSGRPATSTVKGSSGRRRSSRSVRRCCSASSASSSAASAACTSAVASAGGGATCATTGETSTVSRIPCTDQPPSVAMGHAAPRADRDGYGLLRPLLQAFSRREAGLPGRTPTTPCGRSAAFA